MVLLLLLLLFHLFTEQLIVALNLFVLRIFPYRLSNLPASISTQESKFFPHLLGSHKRVNCCLMLLIPQESKLFHLLGSMKDPKDLKC